MRLTFLKNKHIEPEKKFTDSYKKARITKRGSLFKQWLTFRKYPEGRMHVKHSPRPNNSVISGQ